MTGYERITRILDGSLVGRPAMMRHAFMSAAAEAGVSMRQDREKPVLMARARVAFAGNYGPDGAFTDIDTALAAGTFGAGADFPESEPARVAGPAPGTPAPGTPAPVAAGARTVLGLFQGGGLIKTFVGNRARIPATPSNRQNTMSLTPERDQRSAGFPVRGTARGIAGWRDTSRRALVLLFPFFMLPSSLPAQPRILWGALTSADIHKDTSARIASIWYNGPGDLGWMRGYKNTSAISDLYGAGKAVQLIVWLADAGRVDASGNTVPKQITNPADPSGPKIDNPAYAAATPYFLSEQFHADIRELAEIFRGQDPRHGPLYVVLFTEIETYYDLNTAEGRARRDALKAGYIRAAAAIRSTCANAFVGLGLGGYAWPAAPGGNRSDLAYWEDALAASEWLPASIPLGGLATAAGQPVEFRLYFWCDTPLTSGFEKILLECDNLAVRGFPGAAPPPAAPPGFAPGGDLPAAQTVTAGGTATLNVSATGAPPLRYAWKKNGADIPGAPDAPAHTFTAATADDGSRFSVTVSNTAGSAGSAELTLTVNPPPPASVTVTFDAQGGTLAPQDATKTVTQGAPYGALPAPTRASHTFAGWWTAPGDAGAQVTEATTLVLADAGNHTLYAKWTAIPPPPAPPAPPGDAGNSNHNSDGDGDTGGGGGALGAVYCLGIVFFFLLRSIKKAQASPITQSSSRHPPLP